MLFHLKHKAEACRGQPFFLWEADMMGTREPVSWNASA